MKTASCVKTTWTFGSTTVTIARFFELWTASESRWKISNSIVFDFVFDSFVFCLCQPCFLLFEMLYHTD